MNFNGLGLDPDILRAISAAGYTKPTPIQKHAIPTILAGGDITGIAQTGTGKTAAFVLPMIHLLARGRARARMPRSLILEPTRELAAQVAENFKIYGTHHNLDPALLIGGVSFAEQDRKLMRGADVLIATPGRLLDHFERGKLLLTGVHMLVIDEADRMLDMGFIPDIERICSLMPKKRQTLLFSATIPPEIARLAKRFQNLPETIRVDGPKKVATGDNISQFIIHLPNDQDTLRRAALRAAIRSSNADGGIVFCNRKREVDVLATSMRKHRFNAYGIHGDMPQQLRTQTLNGFRDGKIKFLIASDVAARGLDIPDVSFVFNFAPPPNSDDYVHRIGRTGRAGKSGSSLTLIAPDDSRLWDSIVERINPNVTVYTSRELDTVLNDPQRREKTSQRKTRHRQTKQTSSNRNTISTQQASAPETTGIPQSLPEDSPKRKRRRRRKNSGSGQNPKNQPEQ